VIDSPVQRPMIERLSPVRCGRCSRPVTHMNKAVPGAEAGGLCQHCTRDKRMEVWTYCAIAASSSDSYDPSSGDRGDRAT
jgi:hypothetical protein